MYKIFQDLDQPIKIKAYLNSGISHHGRSTILPVVTRIFVKFYSAVILALKSFSVESDIFKFKLLWK